MPPLSPKARLRAANPTLKVDYVLDPESDMNALSDEFKLMQEAAAMSSVNTQRVLDKMMPIVGYFDNGRFVAVATCDEPGCGRTTRWSSDSMPNPSTVFTKIRNRDWQVSKKKVTCPPCNKRKKQRATVREYKREPEAPMKPIGEALREAVVRHDPAQPLAGREIDQVWVDDERPAEGENQVPQDTTTAPTDKAKAAKRAAYALLLDHYDEGGKRYNGDWSDRRIAEMTGLSEAKVAALREEDFGPAGPPPQLIDLKTRLTSLETKLRDKEQAVLRAMDEIPEMQEEVKLLQSQLAALVQAHGWAS